MDEYGTDFDLPDDDKSELEQITFTLHKEQAEFIKYAISQIDEHTETFGNTNKMVMIFMSWLKLPQRLYVINLKLLL